MSLVLERWLCLRDFTRLTDDEVSKVTFVINSFGSFSEAVRSAIPRPHGTNGQATSKQ